MNKAWLNLPKYKILLVMSDTLIIISSIILSRYIVDAINSHYIFEIDSNYLPFVIIFIGVILIHLFIFQFNNLYKINIFLSYFHHVLSVIKSVYFSLFLIIIVSFLLKFPFIIDSRLYIIVYSITLIISLLVFRVIILKYIYLRMKNSKLTQSTALIYGGGKAGKLIGAKLLFEKQHAVDIVGFIDDEVSLGTEIIPGKRVISTIENIEDYLSGNGRIEEVIIAIDNITYDRMLDVIQFFQRIGLRVRVSSGLFNILPQRMEIEKFGNIPILNVSSQIKRDYYLQAKKITDILGSLAGLILLFPLFFIICLLIKLSSKGPVIYSQNRIGINGKQFKFYKFRSMTVTDNEDVERQKMMLEFIKNNKTLSSTDSKIVNKSRITWIGKIIRKISIDELPQFFNVLKGDMSLVGPRPCLCYEYENYDDWHKRRLSVLPGCTGVWQVFGRSNVTFKDSMVLDMYYINNMSPWLDMQIVLKTIPVMLFAKGGK